MISPLLFVLIAMTVVMLTGWAFQRAAKNGGWTDVFWTYGTGVTCAIAALVPMGEPAGATWRRVLVAVMVAAWALRLGTYVALRVSRSHEDVRYAALHQEWGDKFQRNMFGLLVLQAPITALMSVSVILAARQPAPGLRAADALGVLLLLIAVGGETLADGQMKRFKADAANAGKVCDRGLWAWSRHPNYFFEAFGWLAYTVIAVDPARPWTWAASLLAPIMMFVVVRYMTGAPPLEKAMVQSKGDAYRRYQAEVSMLIPLPRRKA